MGMSGFSIYVSSNLPVGVDLSGNLHNSTGYPAFPSSVTSSLACVLFPDLSIPSNAIHQPRRVLDIFILYCIHGCIQYIGCLMSKVFSNRHSLLITMDTFVTCPDRDSISQMRITACPQCSTKTSREQDGNWLGVDRANWDTKSLQIVVLPSMPLSKVEKLYWKSPPLHHQVEKFGILSQLAGLHCKIYSKKFKFNLKPYTYRIIYN